MYLLEPIPGQEIERAAEIVTAETGWRLYDPQLETFFDCSGAASGATRG